MSSTWSFSSICRAQEVENDLTTNFKTEGKELFYSLETAILKPEACLQMRNTAAGGKVYSQKSDQIRVRSMSDTQDQTTPLLDQLRFSYRRKGYSS